MNGRGRPEAAPESAPTTATANTMLAGRCRVCGVDVPGGHVYCSRFCAMWDRREHLDGEAAEA
jgi:hypothetical protein